MVWGGRWEGGSGWGTRATDSLMFICNLALSFNGQDYVWSYTFGCCDQKCCVSILDRWLRRPCPCGLLCLTFATPWTVAHQSPLSMEIFRQEHWNRLPPFSRGIFPTQRSNPYLLCLLSLLMIIYLILYI